MSKYVDLRSDQVANLSDWYIDALFYNICEILDERGDLNMVTTAVANNVAFLEYVTTKLQDDIVTRKCITEVENGSQLFFKVNPSISEVRGNMTALTKFYKELRLLPEEVKPVEEHDELLEFLKNGVK